MKNAELSQKIEEKYKLLGENHETYLEGLIHTKPVTYWDYIQVDTLLSLQKPKTNFKDEEIFVMYHQVTELVLKMMIHEIKQMFEDQLTEEIWIDKFERLNRYTSMLISSFDVMKYGMNYDDYNTFRTSLAPASGFQSVQFRMLELYCTRIENLINQSGKKRLPEKPTLEDLFDSIYWKDAGLDRKTGKKSLTLRLFEEKYLHQLMEIAQKVGGNTLEEKVNSFKNVSPNLIQKMREFDYLYNVAWPIVHLETAEHYLDAKGENKAATGGSEWKKYLHPSYQQRKFFPNLWSEEEHQNWGNFKI